MTIARTKGSAPSRPTAAISSSITSRLRALRLSGRLSVMVAVGPSSRTRTCPASTVPAVMLATIRLMSETSANKPTLYVCHGDDGGPRMHPCRRVQEAMREKGIDYEKVIAAKGNPIPFLRRGSREELRQATGDTKVPALKLADGTVITHSKAILA